MSRRLWLAGGALAAFVAVWEGPQRAAQERDPAVVWSIGRADHSSDDVPADWAKAPAVVVKLDEKRLELVADIYFRVRAPQGLVLTVNGKRGYFPIRPERGPDTDERQSNTVLYSRQTLRVAIPPEYLAAGENRITIAPDGEGEIDWDALELRRDGREPAGWSARVEPTVFYQKGQAGRLVELADLVVRFPQSFAEGRAELDVGPNRVSTAIESRGYDFGELAFRVAVPAVERPVSFLARVKAGDRQFDAKGQFVPEKRWRLFAGFKIHNDIGFTDIQPHIQELDNRNTDGVVDLARRFPFYKFNLETGWLAENYLASRDAEAARRLLLLAQQGRIGINVLYLNVMTGLCTGEELYRSLYYSYGLHKKHGTPFRFGCLTDAPSHSWFVPTLLAGVGVKGFALGSNQTRAPLLQNSSLNEESPFWWEGADGQRVLSWYARSYLQFHRLLSRREGGGPLEATIPQFLARYRRSDYVPDAVLVYGLYTDNAEIGHGEAKTVEEWNGKYEYPKIVPALDSDYFDYVEKNFGGKLAVRRGDGGAYWEDGVGSTALETALNRDTQRLLPAAEMAGALAAALDPRLRYPAEEFREAWKNLMFYDEHTWGAYSSISQPDKEFVTRQWEVKRSFAWRAHWAAKDLLTRSLNRLVQHIGRDGRMIYVFNPDVWPRTDVVQVELNRGQGVGEPLDTVVERDGYRVARFLARDVPPLGYRTYPVRPEQATPAPASGSGRQIESRYYRVRLDPVTGAIASLYDKELGKELADGPLNELLYVSGGEQSRILWDRSNAPAAKLEIRRASGASVVENRGKRLRVRARAPHIPKLETEIALYDEIRRVDIVNRLEKEAVRAKEAVYFAFPFQVSPPELLYQVQNGFVRAEHDQLPGAGREWFTTQNLIVARGGGVAVAWATPDAPLVTLTDINRGKWPKRLDVRTAHVYSYVMNNYWFTNYKADQGGEFTFRYAITSGREVAQARFDAETRSPLIVYPYVDSTNISFAQREGKLPIGQGTFFEVKGDHVQLVAFKPAEDAEGWIVRLKETEGRGGTARLGGFPFPVGRAWLANGVEENIRPLEIRSGGVEVPLGAYQYTTVRLTRGGSGR